MMKKNMWQNLPVEEENLNSTSPNGVSANANNSPPASEKNIAGKNSPLWRGGRPQPDGVVVRGTIPFMSLPYNPELRDRARALRKAGMLHEALLWKRLKNRRFHGLDFDRQKIIGNYIVDFFCASELLVIEIDGCSHDNKVEYDKKREDYLLSLGLRVVHIRASEVLQNMEVVIYRLHALTFAATKNIEGDGLGE